METKILLKKLIEKKDLTKKESLFLVSEMAENKMTNSQMAAVLVLLKSKGETIDEIVGFIKGMRKFVVKVKNSSIRQAQDKTQSLIDVCGTGGDGKHTFNISTAVSFVVAGCGVKVAKHGNRTASSKCGSADVLEALGVNINLNSEQASLVLENVGMVFLFAPLFHPAMKYIGPVRKELEIPTIFNILGPFLNPCSVKRQIIGVANINIAKKLADVAAKLSYKHLIILVSQDGMDEASISSSTKLFEIKGKSIKSKTISFADFGINKSSLKNILGKDPIYNAEIIRKILYGKKGPKRDVVILNSALALYVAGKVKSIKKGIILAKKSIDRGDALKVLENLIKETRKYE